MTLINGGLGGRYPRSQQHFKDSDKMEASYLYVLLFGSAPSPRPIVTQEKRS